MASSGGDSFGPGEFIETSRFSFNVRWVALGSTILSGTVVVFFQTIIGFIRSVGLGLEAVLNTGTARITGVIEALFQAVGIMDAAWAAAAADLAGAGIFAFALSVAVAGAVVLIYSWGVRALVE
ncbi:hypothetical protein [Natronomonas marina]|uniref:hypothetical protein n=1 Tax=Natronomonas marina TaxID=2961939 RepID=UPI0020C93BD2|nr:hypothetical protein [Natronomonas marina]